MNALVSYASDSESDSESGDLLPATTTTTTTVVAAQKTAPLTNASTPTAVTASSSAVPSKHHTPEGTPGTRTPDLREETDDQQEIREAHPQQKEQQGGEEDEDDFVSAALKDLQSFAASVDDSTTSPQQDADTAMTVTAPPIDDSSLSTAITIAAVSGTQPSQDSDQPDSTAMDVDQTDIAVATATATTVVTVPPQPSTPFELTTEQQIVFDTFLQEINAIPLLPLPSTDQPRLPPRPPRASSSTNSLSLPSTSTTSLNDDDHWIQTQTPQTIYSRIHQLSTLPQTDRFNPKEVENRLIEFAIRLLDWEQGGLKPVYFLGDERATRELESHRREKEEEVEMSGESDIDDEEKEDLQAGSLPRYGGVVGEMIEFMHTVEKIAPPDDHWLIIWSLKELSYGFFHPATGTKSDEYPSTELRNRLNPPSTTSGITTLTTAT
ncbi:hypothetical protein K457DRAFT_14715 [Linnemannia elongata AG-77]|uniref:Uncharacterized protein n=1 Tax=Linnemannia elongata AG-77 TaxID=1314771 RepID=A0A197KA02_9FUNG|nr:hypothetical protein K457DRAFT_14715 [Linnemannia elongata AG-77]